MRLDLDLDDAVTGAARPGLAATSEPHLRAVLEGGGQLQVDRLAVGEPEALRRERRRILERHGKRIDDVCTFRLLLAPPEAAEAARETTAAPAEQPFEQVARIAAA